MGGASLQAWPSLLLAGGAALCLAGLLLALANHLAMVWLGLAVMGMAAALLVPTYTTLASLAAGQAGQSRVAGAIAATHTVGFSLAAGLAGALFGLWVDSAFPAGVAAGRGRWCWVDC